MPHEFIEYPKWLHHPVHKSVLVEDADAEAAQLAVWDAPAGNRLLARAETVQAPPKSRGGWPKGKPRKPSQATVN